MREREREREREKERCKEKEIPNQMAFGKESGEKKTSPRNSLFILINLSKNHLLCSTLTFRLGMVKSCGTRLLDCPVGLLGVLLATAFRGETGKNLSKSSDCVEV